MFLNSPTDAFFFVTSSRFKIEKILRFTASLVLKIPVPKVPFSFVFFDKLKYKIRNNVLISVFILKLRHKI